MAGVLVRGQTELPMGGQAMIRWLICKIIGHWHFSPTGKISEPDFEWARLDARGVPTRMIAMKAYCFRCKKNVDIWRS